MNLVHRKRYTAEFKAPAVELLSAGKPVSQVAEELCISSNLLYNWRHSSQGAQLGSAGAQAAGEHSEADELRASAWAWPFPARSRTAALPGSLFDL
jgi:transposase-like protein